MQQRYYDPQIGRFLSVDPVTADSGTGANFNRYWYADDNPYTFNDPDGRETGAAYGAIYIADQRRGRQQPAGRPTGGPGPKASRYNNPELASNATTGAGVGLVIGTAVGVSLVAANIVGFPEVEGTELLMAIAGEPIITPLLVGTTAGAGPGTIVGIAAGVAATTPTEPKPATPPPPVKPAAPPSPPPPPPSPPSPTRKRYDDTNN